MRLELLGIVAGKSLLQRLLCLALRVAADVVIVDEIRGSSEIDRCGGGTGDPQTVVFTQELAVALYRHLSHGM